MKEETKMNILLGITIALLVVEAVLSIIYPEYKALFW